MFDILSEKLRVNILSRSMAYEIPNSLNLSTPQISFHSVLYFFKPIHTTYVFEKFTFRPEIFAQFSSSLNVPFRDSSNQSSMTDVSPLY